MGGSCRAIDASAGGAVGAVATGKLCGVRLVAGADAATATIREVDGSGAILAKLSCPAANDADEFAPPVPVLYQTALHVTLTGTSPVCLVYVD